MRVASFALLTLVTAVWLAACQGETPVDEERYELRGKIVAVDAEAGKVTVDHEDIEGFMEGMTMEFPLKDEWAFQSLQPGDGINAMLAVRGEDYWLEQSVISRASADANMEPPEPRIGEPVPDIELINQDGENIRVSDYRGKALVVTFIYTRCPLSEFCPRMTRHFSELEKRLQDDPELYDRTHLLTISFDPDYDTPETLRDYAIEEAGLSADVFDHCELATGADEEVRRLGDFLYLEYVAAHDEIVHNLRTAIVAPDGTLFQVYTGNFWTPDDVLEALGDVPFDGEI